MSSPTLYVDDEGKTYPPGSTQLQRAQRLGVKLYPMYGENVIQELIAANKRMEEQMSAGMVLLTPNARLWELLSEIRIKGPQAILGWQHSRYGQEWVDIPFLRHNRFTLNSDLFYRRKPE
jgi:hypothetical protein